MLDTNPNLLSGFHSATSATFQIADLSLHYTSGTPSEVIKKARQLLLSEDSKCPITASLSKLDSFADLAKKSLGKNGSCLYLNGELISLDTKKLIKAAKSKVADSLVPFIETEKFDNIFSFKEICPAVISVRCESLLVLNFTFMRLAEHYESACEKFRGGKFSRQEFKDWYTEQNDGVFTYYDDWGGFNIPCESFSSFIEAGFSDLLPIEEFLVRRLKEASKEIRGRFYIIGTDISENTTFLEHELAHAFYSLNSDYSAEIDNALLQIPKDQQDIMNSLLMSYGYNELVLQDETQAFLLHAPEYFENMAWSKKGLLTTVLLPVHQKISEIFRKYYSISQAD